MKHEEPTIIDAVKLLEKYFSKFNERYFDNQLSKPVITISPDTTKKSLGWCTTWKAWKDSTNTDKESGYYEINICAEYLTRPIDEVCGTLLHEMVHLHNIQNGVQDCSRSGTYHNVKFRDAAKTHGLIVKKDTKYGWTITSLTNEAKAFVQSFADTPIPLYRTERVKSQEQKSSTRKYVCPMCGCIIRATREVHIICGECEEPFREEK